MLNHVIAKAPAGPPPPLEQFRLMLRVLLGDRFQLRVHHAWKNLPVYNLTVAKDGPKFRENPSDTKGSLAMRDGRLFRIRAVHIPMATLVDELSNPNHGAGRPVFDKTGLTGFYDFEIDWAPNDLTAGLDGPADATAPSVVTALPERLGLKLEAVTAAGNTVVIDHAEKPSRN